MATQGLQMSDTNSSFNQPGSSAAQPQIRGVNLMPWDKLLHFLCCFRRGSATRLIKLRLSIGVAAQLCALKNLVTAILPFVFAPSSLPMSQLQEVFSQIIFCMIFFNITVYDTLITILHWQTIKNI